MILQKLSQITFYEVLVLYAFFFVFPTVGMYLSYKEKNKKKFIQGFIVFSFVLSSYFGFNNLMSEYRHFEKYLTPGTTLTPRPSVTAPGPIKVQNVETKWVTVNSGSGDIKKTKDYLFRYYQPKSR